MMLIVMVSIVLPAAYAAPSIARPLPSGAPCVPGPLGMDSGAIPDDKITASSWVFFAPPEDARLNGDEDGWIPVESKDQWIQVDLGDYTASTGIIIQGNMFDGIYASVTTFSVMYSDTGDSNDWHSVVDAKGNTIQFKGSKNQGEPATVTFPAVLPTRFLRILPLAWSHEYYRVKFEVLGCRGTPCAAGPLGMDSGAIPNDKITASSWVFFAPPEDARLSGDGDGWIPVESKDQWIQVDLGDYTAFTGIIIQGNMFNEIYASVTTFSVMYSDTGNSNDWYSVADAKGNTIQFEGSKNQGEPATVTFPVVLLTRFLRILPLAWSHKYYRVKFEVLGCRGTSCAARPLGMDSGAIPDDKITASSWVFFAPPEDARLNGDGDGWIPVESKDQWIQVDLGDYTAFTGIIIQGNMFDGIYASVTTFSVMYSDTGDSNDWYSVADAKGNTIQFEGGKNEGEPATVTFPVVPLIRFLRILPLAWSHKYYRVKFEVLGCRGPKLTHTKGNAELKKAGAYAARSISMESVIARPLPSGAPCAAGPLGMDSGAIPDDKITASSWVFFAPPEDARLNGDEEGWIPDEKKDQWIQVDLGDYTAFTGIIIQGNMFNEIYASVTTFSVMYSDTGDSNDWHSVADAKGNTIQFEGSKNEGEPATVTFPVVLLTKFLRILPLEWSHEYYRVKFEVLGCRDVEGMVRLMDGDGIRSGRVEILHSGSWGAVCDNGWDLPDATVTCRQLGYLEAQEANTGSFFGSSQLDGVMDGVACEGTEKRLADCLFVCPRHECSSYPGVVCKENTVRLVNGSTPTTGRVEVYRDRSWGTICDNNWDLTDAGVLCRELGFPGALEAVSGPRFGQGAGPVHMGGLACKGTEKAIADCPSHCWQSECDHSYDAGVVCQAK